ncbi:hypothetical protein Droror1_Dr00027874, partial [Drosera rotundifolia]
AEHLRSLIDIEDSWRLVYVESRARGKESKVLNIALLGVCLKKKLLVVAGVLGFGQFCEKGGHLRSLIDIEDGQGLVCIDSRARGKESKVLNVALLGVCLNKKLLAIAVVSGFDPFCEKVIRGARARSRA